MVEWDLALCLNAFIISFPSFPDKTLKSLRTDLSYGIVNLLFSNIGVQNSLNNKTFLFFR